MIKQRKKGFTLIELIVVVAIIAIIAAVLVPAITGLIDKAKVSSCLALYDSVHAAGVAYKGDTGIYPNQTALHNSGLVRNVNPFTGSWDGPYLNIDQSTNYAHQWGGITHLQNVNLEGAGNADWVLRLDNACAFGGGATCFVRPAGARNDLDKKIDKGQINFGNGLGRFQGGNEFRLIMEIDAF